MSETTQEQIGKRIITGTRQRDAIHFAVLPAIATNDVYPGQHVGFKDGEATRHNTIGIVDPFREGKIKEGEQFFIILYPNTVTSMRHVWSHPGITDEGGSREAISSTKEESEQWLRNFIRAADCPGFEDVISCALEENQRDGDYNNGDYLHFDDRDAHGDIPPAFWEHLENYTGKKISSEKRAEFFSCSC